MQAIALKHGSSEWLKYRGKGIGGSDASAVLGMNPYKTNVELWEEKVGIRLPKPVSCIEAVEYGHKAEEPLRALFCLNFPEFEVVDTKDKVYLKDFMFASLDGLLIEKETGRKGVLEIKTADIFQSMHKERWNEKVPDNYYIQVLHYMTVTDADFAILEACLKYEKEGMLDLRIKHYYFDRKQIQEDIDYLVAKEQEFWRMVQQKVRPRLILPEV